MTAAAAKHADSHSRSLFEQGLGLARRDRGGGTEHPLPGQSNE